MGVYEKAVFYHFIHGLGMLIVSILRRWEFWPNRRIVGMLAAGRGDFDFSGSLYLLAVTGVRAWGR